jgi:hypothetical protein
VAVSNPQKGVGQDITGIQHTVFVLLMAPRVPNPVEVAELITIGILAHARVFIPLLQVAVQSPQAAVEQGGTGIIIVAHVNPILIVGLQQRVVEQTIIGIRTHVAVRQAVIRLRPVVDMIITGIMDPALANRQLLALLQQQDVERTTTGIHTIVRANHIRFPIQNLHVHLPQQAAGKIITGIHILVIASNIHQVMSVMSLLAVVELDGIGIVKLVLASLQAMLKFIMRLMIHPPMLMIKILTG